MGRPTGRSSILGHSRRSRSADPIPVPRLWGCIPLSTSIQNAEGRAPEMVRVAPYQAKTNGSLRAKLDTALTQAIRIMERQLDALATTRYPETAQLRQVGGVGPITALAYVLTLEEPYRFQTSRSVGPYLGLCPRQDDSGDRHPQLRITKRGDAMLRRLLVNGAHYILGPFGPDCDLRRWGLRLAARGGTNAKKRAVVAVARKLAILLHALWVNGEVYEPVRRAA